jgi:HEAT repeat protein
MTESSADLARLLGGKPEEVAEHLSSDDADLQGQALKELIARGTRSVPALLDALKNGDAPTRALAVEGLATIADPSTADVLNGALDDKDGKVRARAATGLMNIGDPRALDALIATLNDFSDTLSEYSLSTFALSQYGPKALPKVAPLLKAEDQPTRSKAIYIIQKIVSQMKSSKPDPELRKALREFDPAATTKERDAVADTIMASLSKMKLAKKDDK